MHIRPRRVHPKDSDFREAKQDGTAEKRPEAAQENRG